MSEARQSRLPCQNCGSYYRREETCNACGTKLEPDSWPEKKFIHNYKGAGWNKKQHKVVWTS